MKAKMTVTKLELRKIKLMQDTGRVGHNFELVAKVRVQPRTMGALSGEGIECPELQWIETIDWYRFDTFTNNWIQAGTQTRNKDLYKANPTSHTFNTWQEENRYAFARHTPWFPAALKNTYGTEAKHWIAQNGFEWEIPIKDIPAMSLQGGSGGGAGTSLVIGPTRRRIIRFELGFTGCQQRIHCAQILETMNGRVTMHAFIQRKLSDAELNAPQNVITWRNLVGA
ncbi:hypothetical protein AB6880_03310 [Rahnella inusitata]|uniref:hypothetical protein n=1 Tax=Rahnella inusitata TaxID=58169 RepID=UPI0039BE874A